MNASHTQPEPPMLHLTELECDGANAGDATLMVVDADRRGIFAALRKAELSRRIVMPARWLPARTPEEGGIGDHDRILWVARSNHALAQLLAPHDDSPAWLGDTARPGEPVALLGVPGDVVTSTPDVDPHGIVRRTERWIQRLGFDRVMVAIPASAGAAHPLFALARRRRIGVVRVGTTVDQCVGQPVESPLLWTDFQLDAEHRLPDESAIPGLRDLLYRGSLLRSRTLYDRLPEATRSGLDAELRALYSWHVSPILRRCGALMQTLMPVPSLRWEAPLSCRSHVGYLLGLCEAPADESADSVSAARELVQELHAWDRSIQVHLPAAAWKGLRARLLPWAEAGHLASFSVNGDRRTFCFSGQPLWARLPLHSAPDGVAALSLNREDCDALGWFRLALTWEEEESLVPTGRLADLHTFDFSARREEDQLPLDLEGTGA